MVDDERTKEKSSFRQVRPSLLVRGRPAFFMVDNRQISSISVYLGHNIETMLHLGLTQHGFPRENRRAK
jgi:hypothetical protein